MRRVAGGDVDDAASWRRSQPSGSRRGAQPVAERHDRAFVGVIDRARRHAASCRRGSRRGPSTPIAVNSRSLCSPSSSSPIAVNNRTARPASRAAPRRRRRRLRVLPRLGRVHDVAGRRDGVDVGERDPFRCPTTGRASAILSGVARCSRKLADATDVRLTAFSHGAGCACKLGRRPRHGHGQLGQVAMPDEVLVSAETGDDAAAWRSGTGGRSSRPSTCSRRSWTTRTTGVASPPRTRSAMSTPWAARGSWR